MSLTIVYENPHIGDKSIYSYEDFNTPNGNGKVELSQEIFYIRRMILHCQLRN